MRIRPSITQVSERMVNNMSKVFRLIVDEDNEPVILEEDEVLDNILFRLESISHRQYEMTRRKQKK